MPVSQAVPVVLQMVCDPALIHRLNEINRTFSERSAPTVQARQACRHLGGERQRYFVMDSAGYGKDNLIALGQSELRSATIAAPVP